MPDRIAVKQFTSSDLTFFDTFFRRNNFGNQKAINLNADVFAKKFYPDFAEQAFGREMEVPVAVTVFGPQPGKPYRFARSITKKRTYKNWRLNGAAVPNPEDEANRFDQLRAGDLAVIEFKGSSEPEAVQMAIISSQDDQNLHGRLLRAADIRQGRSMVAISRSRLGEVAEEAQIGPMHPLHALLADPELEEILEQAYLGAEPAVRRLKERTGRRLTKADIQGARNRAEQIGDAGEALAYHLLTKLVHEGKLPEVIWTAQDDAGSSWDFETTGTPATRYDAKATGQRFDTPFHLSGAETAAAASADIPYHIIRLYEVTEDGAKVRISKAINSLARTILESAEILPGGVLPIGFTIAPTALEWGEDLTIERPDEAEDEVTGLLP